MNLLPGLLIVASGLAIIALAVAQRARRPAPVPVAAHGALPVGREDGAQAAAVERERPELAELSTRVTGSCVSVYRGHEPGIRLVAVWRWSRSRGGLAAYDRLDPSWSPAWSRELAQRAWEAR